VPRALTPEERSRIETRLLEAGRGRFIARGLAKTTVAELARDAAIGKGTFYLFFESKEALFLEIQEREEEMFKARLFAEQEEAPSGAQAVGAVLRAAAQRLDRHPFLALLLDPDTIRSLAVRLDPARLEDHRAADREVFTSLDRRWRDRGFVHAHVDPDTVFDVLGALFVLHVQRDLLGAEATARATDALVDAVVARWCSGDSRPDRPEIA
jgi:AcrR family transcriptional regulator